MLEKRVLWTEQRADGEYRYLVGWGLSKDPKPTERVINGSHIVEMDTSTLTYFDEENGQWLPFGEEES